MIGLVTTLSTFGSTAPQAVDSQVEIKASTEYLINTLNIVEMSVSGTTDSDLRYKLNRNEDQSPSFHLRVNETNAAIQALADVAANSNLVSLDIFLGSTSEDVLSYAECALSSSTATTKLINIDDIVWAEENSAATLSLMLIQEGGQSIKKVFVDSNLAQISDMITTGTTTTGA